MNTVLTTTLEIAYEEHGPGDGPAVLLMHGFPDDVLYRPVPRTRRTDCGSLPPTRGTRSGGASGSRAWLWMRITGLPRATPASHSCIGRPKPTKTGSLSWYPRTDPQEICWRARTLR